MDNRELAKSLVKLAKELVSGRPMFDQRAYYRQKMKDRGTEMLDLDNVDMEIYNWQEERDGSEKYYSIGFTGKRTKPDWYYSFKTDEQRDKYVDGQVESRKRQMEYKMQKREERKNYQHGLQVGDFLVSSWGYDQTNIDFYQVTEVKGKMVVIREVASKVVRETIGEWYVEPVKNKFLDGPMRKKVSERDSVRINSYQSAWKWDGRPRGMTSPDYRR